MRTLEGIRYELKWNEGSQRFETTLSDSNGVLSDFDFGISGYSVDKNGNSITKVTDTDRKKSYRKSTIHQSEPKNKGLSRFKQKDAKACYKMNRLVLVNLDILDEYLETFHIEDEEFYK